MNRLCFLGSLSVLFALGCGDSESVNPEAGDGDTGESESGGTESETSGNGDTDGGESGDTGDQACPGPGPWDYGTPIPPNTPQGGDPQAGMLALLNDDYVDCGIPYDLFQLGKGFLGTYADGESFDWRP